MYANLLSKSANKYKYPTLRSIISGHDAICLFEILYKLSLSRSLGSFVEVLEGLKHIVPYDKSVTVLAKIDSNGGIKAYDIINISYPESWLQIYRDKSYEALDPVIKKNFCAYDLFHWENLKIENEGDDEFWNLASDFNLTSGCTYGLPNRSKTIGSLFSFSGGSLHHPRHEAILRIVIPQLDIKLRDIAKAQQQQKLGLTVREIEVLQWVKEGKSNWDIATILNISERTVKFHISSILKKLNVVNRSQAIAVAISKSIIDF